MIGDIGTGASFYHLISYVLEDKINLSEEEKQQRSLREDLQHKERAEVLDYNLCFGDKFELTQQFKEVEKLGNKLKKPVLHLSVRLAPSDQLDKNQLIEIGRACAKEFGVADNQYICVLHKDTKEQHIHIAANRIGFDGKTASDSNSYKRMAALCRTLEKQYNLNEVLSPRRFLSAKDRLIPRHDTRKEKLREDIGQTLKTVNHYTGFEQQMAALGYKVIKGRGISFIDDKKVKVKGSEVGFSLMTIEKVLSLKHELVNRQSVSRQPHFQKEKNGQGFTHERQSLPDNFEKQIENMIEMLLRPEYSGQPETPMWLKKKKKPKLGQGY
jgi:hypothetical protein